MPPYDSRSVANTVLDIAENATLGLTHMALQKVLYYAHAWHLVDLNEPLIRQPFEAWREGPVQRLVWDCFKHVGSKPVTGRATRFDLVQRIHLPVDNRVSDSAKQLLSGIVRDYGHLHAFELSRMTHEAGGPWDQVWNASQGRVTLGMRIENEVIKRHFQRVQRRVQSIS